MDGKYYKNFIYNVDLELKNNGWSRADFALQLNCNSSTVSKWLTGKREPSFEYIVRITKVLGCTFEDLIS